MDYHITYANGKYQNYIIKLMLPNMDILHFTFGLNSTEIDIW